jgi:hypothetical protein
LTDRFRVCGLEHNLLIILTIEMELSELLELGLSVSV